MAVSALSFHLSLDGPPTSTNVRVAVYSDNSGPDALLTESASYADILLTGWNTVPVTLATLPGASWLFRYL